MISITPLIWFGFVDMIILRPSAAGGQELTDCTAHQNSKMFFPYSWRLKRKPPHVTMAIQFILEKQWVITTGGRNLWKQWKPNLWWRHSARLWLWSRRSDNTFHSSLHLSIHPFIFDTCFYPLLGRRGLLEPIPGVRGREAPAAYGTTTFRWRKCPQRL